MPNPILVYTPARYPKGIKVGDEPVVVLAQNDWDDYSYRTTFDVFLLRGKDQTAVGTVKVLVEEEHITSTILGAAPPANVGGQVLEFGNRRFLSLGHDLEYYQELVRLLPNRQEREHVLAALHDTIYLEQRKDDTPDLLLRQAEGFRTSLLRFPHATKAYAQARQVLFADELTPDRFNFTVRFQLKHFSVPHEFQFQFDPGVPQATPTNIVVLTGRNGSGKTQALYHTVDYLLHEGQGSSDNTKDLPFNPLDPEQPPFRHILAVSFSPFEQFPLKAADGQAVPPSGHAEGIRITANPRYTYCGFRDAGNVQANMPARLDRVAWDRTWRALIEIMQHDEDQLHKLAGSDRPKFAALLKVLKEGLGYDSVAIELPVGQQVPGILVYAVESNANGDIHHLDIRIAEDHGRKDLLEMFRSFKSAPKLKFKLDGKLVDRFSAGQAMFLFMVFGVIAGVRRDSLVLVDEPELHLHPNLEIAYLRMLITLLQLFESYAIVATHSVFVARETPMRNVRIVSEGEGGRPLVNPPSVETFGADVAEIANLIFDHVSAEKPFQVWLRTLIPKEPSYDQVRAQFGKLLNSESLTFLRNEIAHQKEVAEQAAEANQQQAANPQADPGTDAKA